jgi:hypothetical protein
MNFLFVLVQFNVVYVFQKLFKQVNKKIPLSPYDLFLNKHNELIWKSSMKSDYFLIEYSNDRVSKSPYYLNPSIFQTNNSIEFYFRIYSINHIGISEPSQIYKYNSTSSSSSLFPLNYFSNIQTFLRINSIFFYIILMFICIIITRCCCRIKLNKTKFLQSTNALSSNLNLAESKSR